MMTAMTMTSPTTREPKMARNMHEDILFSGDMPGFGHRMKNYSGSTIAKDHIVCLYATDADTMGITEEFATTTGGQGSTASNTFWGNKVIGVAAETIQDTEEGLVHTCGIVDVSVASTAFGGSSFVKLSGAATGKAIEIGGAYTWGRSRVFGYSLEAGSTTVRIILFPFRM